MKRSKRNRSKSGTTFSEFAPTLMLLFMVFLFPMITLGSLGLRYMFLVNAARLAAQAASQAKSFSANVSSSQLSAVNLASKVATQSAGGFNGVALSNITTSIAICPLSGGTVTRQTAPLSKPADTNVNNYNIEVLLTAKITPLLQTPGSILGTIPGLTAPITTTARSSVFAEYPQGLNQ